MKLSKTIIGGSLILLITFNFFNVLNLIYSLAMVRLLSLSDYGVLSTLTYFVIIFAIFSESIQTVISKYTVKEKSASRIKDILFRAIKKAGKTAGLLFVLYLILGLFISSFLHIQYWLVALAGVALYTSFLAPINRGALQGLKRFQSLGNNMIVEGSFKLLIGVLLVLIGWRVYGAMTGIIIGSLIAFSFSFIQLRGVFSSKRKEAKVQGIYSYARPVFLATFAIILFLSLDIILAKRFFSAELVGVYAISSTIAKIIFTGTQPISRAMFPITAEAENKKSARKALKTAALLVGLVAIVWLILVYIFPGMIVFLFSGKIVQEAVSILLPVSAAMILLAFSNLFILYNLARDRLRHAKWLIIPVVLQVALLFAFHSSLEQFSFALVAASAIFLMSSVLFAYMERKK